MTSIGLHSQSQSPYYSTVKQSSSSGLDGRTFDSQKTDTESGNETLSTYSDIQAKSEENPLIVTITVRGEARKIDLSNDLMASKNIKPIVVSELPEDRYNDYIEMLRHTIAVNKEYLELQHTNASPDAPSVMAMTITQTYGTVVVGGRVVATIDNQGIVMTDNELGQNLQDMFSHDTIGSNGPNLAQARLEKLAKLLGGSMVKADTAMSQMAFNAITSFSSEPPKPDYEGMKKDPLFQQIQGLYAKIEQVGVERSKYLSSQSKNLSVYA